MRNLMHLRKKRGLTQADVAGLAEVTPSTVSSWERGETMASAEHQQALAKAFNVSVNYLNGHPLRIRDDSRVECEEITRLRDLAATCYAGLGAECNLPEPWLDVLLAASNGEPFSTEGLLPFESRRAA